MSERPGGMRLGRQQSFTGSAWREKASSTPPPHAPGRGRVGGTRLGQVDVAGGSSSQTSDDET